MKKKTKIVLIVVAAFLALTAVLVPLYILNDDFNLAVWRFIPTGLPQGFTVTAHSGCEGTQAGTISSMQTGVDAGAEIVEIDLHFNDEGECVLAHDKPVPGESYTTLEEAFLFLAKEKSLKANLDLKSTDNMPFVYRLIEKYDLKTRVFFTGVNEERAATLKKDCPGVAYYLNVGEKSRTKDEVAATIERVENCGAVGVNLHYSRLTKRLVEECHKNGLLVSVYTVDKTVLIPHVILYSPDNITTRRPVCVKRVVTTRPYVNSYGKM